MKLIHLFPDLMNLYGDRGNLLILRKYLEERHIPCEICKIGPNEDLDLTDVGFIYMGPGTEPARNAALYHLCGLDRRLGEALSRQIPMLFTGNSWLALGRSIVTGDGEVFYGLGMLEVETVENCERYTGDAIAEGLEGGPPTVGFLNRCDCVLSSEAPLFTMAMGEGNVPKGKEEGVRRGSLFATHLLGPVLVKNPHLLARLGALLGAEPDPETEEKSEAELAYQVTLKALRERMAK